MIEVVFFDVGDTILHPHPSFPELFSQVCGEHGVLVTPEAVGEVQGRLAPHLIDLAAEAGVDHPSLSQEESRAYWGYLYRRLLGELGLDDEELAGALLERFSESSSYRLFDDALASLRALHAEGYRLGLVSNFEGWLEERLVELEVRALFDVSVISGIVGIEKPDVAIYEIALSRAAVAAERCVMVGDSPANDAEPAAAVGMTPVLVDRTSRYPDFEGHRIESLEELPALVANI